MSINIYTFGRRGGRGRHGGKPTMGPMISSSLKPLVTRAINPVAAFAHARGVTPNAVTITGAFGTILGAAWFYSHENYFWGTLAISFFALSDLLDGAIARFSNKGPSAWGGLLDSTIDRITDAAITIALLLPLIREDDQLAYLGLATLVTGFLTPYIRAKAESFGIPCSVGIAERTERLIIILTGAGLHGLGVPFALAGAFWLLALLGLITVGQRFFVVYRGLAER
jgi:CDP-diacylglycerol---glycerol-3-phosphate 3-phosphatidyltransferase